MSELKKYEQNINNYFKILNNIEDIKKDEIEKKNYCNLIKFNYNLKRTKIYDDKEFCQFNTNKVANTILVAISIENHRIDFINELYNIINNDKIKPILTLTINKHNKTTFLIYYQSYNLYIKKTPKHIVLLEKFILYIKELYYIYLEDNKSNNILNINSKNYQSKLHKNPYWCISHGFSIYNNNIYNLISYKALNDLKIDINISIFKEAQKILKKELYVVLWKKAIYMVQRKFYTKKQLRIIAEHIRTDLKQKDILKIIDDIDNRIDVNYFKNPEYIKQKNKRAYAIRRLKEKRKTKAEVAKLKSIQAKNKNIKIITKAFKRLEKQNLKLTAVNVSNYCNLSISTIKRNLKAAKENYAA